MGLQNFESESPGLPRAVIRCGLGLGVSKTWFFWFLLRVLGGMVWFVTLLPEVATLQSTVAFPAATLEQFLRL